MSKTATYIFARIAFYPTLLYNYLVHLVWKRPWYHRIDDTVLLGALPLRQIAKELVENENVQAVVSTNHKFEVEHFTPTEEEWRQLGVDYLRFAVLDFMGTPSSTQLDEALSFIENHRKQGHSVYVHCKAGRTRSATLVACYLMKTYNMDDADAWTQIISKRSHANLFQIQKDYLHQFHLNRNKPTVV